MKFLQSLAIVLLFSSVVCAQEVIHKVTLPAELTTEISLTSVPKEIEGLQWNRWTSENFTVLALNNEYAQYLHKHLEQVKSWIFTRWGFRDIDFNSECKLICVDDPVLFEKLFKLQRTRVEVRRDEKGAIKETVIFLLANDSPAHSLPTPLTEVCLAELSQKHNVYFRWWSVRGMSLLNGSLDQIRQRTVDFKSKLDADNAMYFSEGLMKMTQQDYVKLTEEQKSLYDSGAMIMCLLVRKEFGQDKFHKILQGTTVPLGSATPTDNSESALRTVLKFDSYGHFDRSLKRFMVDLTRDVADKKTPDEYLQIKESKP